MAFSVLVVDDESDITSLISDVLEDSGYNTEIASDGRSTLKKLSLNKPDAILLDIWLGDPEFDGIDLLTDILKVYPQMPVIMMSGHGNIETAVKSMKLGAFDFIEKPFKIDHLILLLQKVQQHAKTQSEIVDLRSRVVENNKFITESSAMSALVANIKKIAPTNSRILIKGPVGSGKEDTARFMHSLSSRCDEVFLTVHCSEFNNSSFEEIMFGDEKNLGLFDRAARGTLCFHEITDLNESVQIKLLDVLNRGTYKKIGVNDISFEVNARIISTTQRNVGDLIKGGYFKEDLYFRLSSNVLEIPPLAKRTEDILHLTNWFMESISKRNGKLPCILKDEVIKKLESASWPSNVRQLKNVIEWLVIVHGSTYKRVVINSDMLPGDLVHAKNSSGEKFDDNIVNLPLKDARYEFERLYLKSQIERFSGNISRTANFIGMERSALHRKLKLMSINVKEEKQAHAK